MSQEVVHAHSSGEGRPGGMDRAVIWLFAVLVGLPLLCLCVAVGVFAILLLLGPVIGNVFSNIVTTI